jgi:hypothetical protein
VSVPSAAEQPIYDRAIKESLVRLAVTTSPRMWTAEMVEEFSVDGALDAKEWWYTQFGGEHPLVESSTLKLRGFGGPFREMIVSRKHWFPEDPTLAFEVVINAAFEMVDPVYPMAMTVGGIEQTFGVEAEPMRVIQKGSGHVFGASVGKIYIDSGGVIEDSTTARANTQTVHEYICRWNPAATGVPGDHKLTVLYDGVIQHETSAVGFAVQPRYVALGMISSTRKGATPAGTPGVPVFPLVVYNVRVREYLGGGYETQTEPSWTRPDLGNTIDTAADRERFVMDTATWAKVPADAIISANWAKGRDALFDEITIEIMPNDPESATTSNRFSDMRWKGRTLVFDTRVRDDAGNLTAWKRQICAQIETAEMRDGKITIVARDRAMSRLDTFISRAYLNIDPDADALGEVEGVNVGYLLGDIFTDLVSISDAVAGGALGATSTDMKVPEVLPQALSSGGESLLPVLTEWVDRLALEIWRRYATSGSARYGEIVVNLWTFGTGTAGYTFAGAGTADGFENVVDATVKEGNDGTGQAFYRQGTPLFDYVFQSLEFLPTIGSFPTVPYPIADRVVNDSLAELESSGLSVLLGFPKADGTFESGGVARHRYRRENAQRWVLTLTALNHDWPEPTDEIAYDDPDGIGVLETQSWIVSNAAYRYEENEISVTITALNSDWVTAILRGQ